MYKYEDHHDLPMEVDHLYHVRLMGLLRQGRTSFTRPPHGGWPFIPCSSHGPATSKQDFICYY